MIDKYKLRGVVLDDAMKQWVRKHPFLYRDKVREVGDKNVEITYKNAIPKDEYKRLSERYNKYIEVLGAQNAPTTLDDLIKMKYNNRIEYDLLSGYYNSRKSNMISAFSTFDDYKKYIDKIDKHIIGLTTSEGVLIKSQSKHFIERLLGTNEDPKTGRPRNGVEIEQVLEAIVNTERFKVSYDPDVHEYYSDEVRVTINWKTGKLIQVNQNKKRKW